MLYSLRGELVHYDAHSVAVECGGVAYHCQTTYATLSQVASLGAQVRLYTYMHIRQDALDLFGFAELAELNCFKMLIGVSGVGPKVALAILSAMTPERFALCVASADHKAIMAAQGVGAKLAQRIVLELRDKIGKDAIGKGFTSADIAGIASGQSGNAGEAVSALVVLGYSQADAAAAIARLDPETSVEDMIKSGLKALAAKL
jgi:Holliday junction DNA helicase RuvA